MKAQNTYVRTRYKGLCEELPQDIMKAQNTYVRTKYKVPRLKNCLKDM